MVRPLKRPKTPSNTQNAIQPHLTTALLQIIHNPGTLELFSTP